MEEDRMSQLPDDILLLILDKIDTREAVKTTSLLSKRWNNLRYLLPSLRLRFSLSGRCLHYKELRSKLRSLCQLVSQLLSHRDATATIHDFHLSFDLYLSLDLCEREFLEECVLYAINHGVQSLCLNCHIYRGIRLPAAFLTCKTLRELELGQSCSSVKAPGRLSLPNLKSFHLETNLVFDDDDVSMEPFSGLPELEKLTLIKCSWDGLVIKAPKLRVLEIIDSYKVKEIYAPLLTSFRYESAVAWECTKVNLPMLEQVCLDIQGRKYCYNVNHTNFDSMLRQLRNATSVSLSLDTIQILLTNDGSLKQTPPPFSNMKCLKVMEGRCGFSQVLQSEMDYLRQTFNCEVKVSPNISVVEQYTNVEEYNYVIKYYH